MNLALFNFDGTITTREMFPDFMHYAVLPTRLAIGKFILSPLVAGYKLGVVSGSIIRASVVSFGFRGIPEHRVKQSGKNFSDNVLPGVLRPEALERIHWHKAQGDTIVVVSGALDVYLSHWCRQHDLELICSRLEAKDGALTGRHQGAQCVLKEKPRRVAERYDLGKFPVVYAYGDTKEDLDLLAIANRKYYRWQEVA
ncbi:MAG TPA: HAD family hydrolase [Pseudoxanthomonas sp.]